MVHSAPTGYALWLFISCPSYDRYAKGASVTITPAKMPVPTLPSGGEQSHTTSRLWMVEHDGHVGQLLKKLDDLSVANNTLVVYTTDNGAEVMSWPDGGNTPFRGEKATNWEGRFRVPMAIRWPGVITPGTIYNDMVAHEDLLPTFAAAV